jgi:hypothetical protein
VIILILAMLLSVPAFDTDTYFEDSDSYQMPLQMISVFEPG